MHEATRVLPQSFTEIKFSDKDIERFWSKVNKGSDGECWDWVRGKDKDGYGSFWLNNEDIRAHRLSYIIKNGQIPRNMFICHKCDNPACVNPDHLFLGSNRDNINDMLSKGRTRKGEMNNGARLKERQVTEIKKIYLTGKVSSRALAKQFGVGKGTILRIVNGDTWGHNDLPEGVESIDCIKQIAKARRDIHAVSNEDVLKVYDLYFTGVISARKIGEMFGVAKRTILSIINGGYASRVPLPPHIPSFDALRDIAVSKRRNQKAQHSHL